jgi:hypothetical protein
MTTFVVYGQIDGEKKMEYDIHIRLMYAMRTTKANQVFEDILSMSLDTLLSDVSLDKIWISFSY